MNPSNSTGIQHTPELRLVGYDLPSVTESSISRTLALSLWYTALGLLDAHQLYQQCDRIGLCPFWDQDQMHFWVNDPRVGPVRICFESESVKVH